MSVRWKVDRTLVWPAFAQHVDDLLSADPAEWVVTYGFRTHDEQAALYEKFLHGGPKAAPPGHSAHEGNGTPGTALAVDVTLVVSGQDDWNYSHPDWRRLVESVRSSKYLHSLADIGDVDHIEAVNWRAIRDTLQNG